MFSCQATEVRKFAPKLPVWDLRQYVRDVRSGNVGMMTILHSFLVWIINKIQYARRGMMYPYVEGKLKKTPTEVLNLQPGELVEVRSKAEILATLAVNERNRGLLFDPEMVQYCGRQFKVLRRVKQIIDDRTAKMVKMKGDCIVLDGVTCESDYHFFCPRSIYPYWREIWLRRVGDTGRGPEQPLPRMDKILDRFFNWMRRWERPREIVCEYRGEQCIGVGQPQSAESRSDRQEPPEGLV